MATSAENSGTSQGVGLAIGSKIGKYEVVERSGVGGQAIVYKCYDRMLDRFVAAKQISPHMAEDPKFVERFRREAQILAKLGAEGTSIVTIHDLLEEPQGLFIVMEFVQGHTLEEVLRDTAGPTEPKAVLQILWRLAAALHAVHAAGIIHRDLKPGNIIIAEGLRPKITDFGVAASRTGQTSMLLGTTKYMAPELFVGGDADGRCDMYSLGIVAYELLLGRPKFNEVFADIVRDPHSEALRWMKWHSNDQEVAPPLHKLNAAVPEGLSEIVAKMMAKKREDRFESMEALGRAIRVSFSPRGKGAAAPAVGPAGSHRAADGAKAAAGAGAGGAMAEAEGDELDIHGPPATAAIPRKPMALRTKLVLAGVAFAMVLTGVIVLVVRAGQESARIDKAAAYVYHGGDGNYKAGKFEDALLAFEDVTRKYPGTLWDKCARVMMPLARCRIAERDANTSEDWENVAREENLAQEEAKNAEKDKALENWAREVLKQIEDLDKGRIVLRQFRREMARAEEAFTNKKYLEVVGILDLLSPMGLSEDQKKQRESLKQKATRAEFDKNYADAVAKGDELARMADPPKLEDLQKEMDYDGAKTAYDAASKLLNNNSTIVPPSEVDAKNKALDHKKDLLNKKRDYRDAAGRLSKATTPQDKRDALIAMSRIENLLGLATNAEQAKIAEAQAEVLMKQAQDAFTAGKFDEAKRLAQNALKQVPNYASARDMLDKLDKGEKRKDLIGQGDSLRTAGNFAEALKKYLEASDLAPDDDLTGKIKDCQYQLKLKEYERLVAEGKYDPAIKVLEEARALNPSQSPKIDALESVIKSKRDVADLLAKGDEAMKANDFSKARGFYGQARKVMGAASPEIVQKIATATYQEYLKLGRDALASKDYQSALAYFKLARAQVKDAGVKPDEIDGLIGKAEDELKATSP